MSAWTALDAMQQNTIPHTFFPVLLLTASLISKGPKRSSVVYSKRFARCDRSGGRSLMICWHIIPSRLRHVTQLFTIFFAVLRPCMSHALFLVCSNVAATPSWFDSCASLISKVTSHEQNGIRGTTLPFSPQDWTLPPQRRSSLFSSL